MSSRVNAPHRSRGYARKLVANGSSKQADSSDPDMCQEVLDPDECKGVGDLDTSFGAVVFDDTLSKTENQVRFCLINDRSAVG